MSYAKWLWSCNHKDIGTLYLIAGVWAGMIGIGLSIIIRLELGQPGSLMGDDQIYNVVVTAHAFNSIFFVMLPILIGSLGNWLFYLMLKDPSLAFPRMNNMSFWFLIIALFMLLTMSLMKWGIGMEWWTVVYPSLKTNLPHSGFSVYFTIFYYLILVSCILGAVNFVSTVKYVKIFIMFLLTQTSFPYFIWVMFIMTLGMFNKI